MASGIHNTIVRPAEDKRTATLVRRAFDWWPYVLIAISAIGFAYMLWDTVR
jgi:hypothetical protein